MQEKLTRALIDTAVKIGARTVLLPECGHAYGAARWEAAKWYGQALPVRIIHMTEFLDELITSGQIRVNKIGETATFHDPCQIVRRGGLEAAARRVLAALGFILPLTLAGKWVRAVRLLPMIVLCALSVARVAIREPERQRRPHDQRPLPPERGPRPLPMHADMPEERQRVKRRYRRAS